MNYKVLAYMHSMAPTNEREKYGVKEGATFFGQFFPMDRYTTKYFTKELNVVWVMSKIDHYLLPRCI